jgi:hypothetical protein
LAVEGVCLDIGQHRDRVVAVAVDRARDNDVDQGGAGVAGEDQVAADLGRLRGAEIEEDVAATWFGGMPPQSSEKQRGKNNEPPSTTTFFSNVFPNPLSVPLGSGPSPTEPLQR